MEPGENWIDETYERKIGLGPLPGWELPLDWTTPDITSDKKASKHHSYTDSKEFLRRNSDAPEQTITMTNKTTSFSLEADIVSRMIYYWETAFRLDSAGYYQRQEDKQALRQFFLVRHVPQCYSIEVALFGRFFFLLNDGAP